MKFVLVIWLGLGGGVTIETDSREACEHAKRSAEAEIKKDYGGNVVLACVEVPQ